MAAGSVGAEANAVVGATHVGLVLGVAVHGAQLGDPVGKLALLPVLADTVLLHQKYRLHTFIHLCSHVEQKRSINLKFSPERSIGNMHVYTVQRIIRNYRHPNILNVTELL